MAERARSLYRRSRKFNCSVAARPGDCRYEASRTRPRMATALWLGAQRLAIDLGLSVDRYQCPPTRENPASRARNLRRVRGELCH